MTRMKLSGAAVLLLALAACGAPGARSGDPVFYPPAPDAPRVQFLRAVTNNLDIQPAQSSLDAMLFGDPRAERWISSPHGITYFEGLFYVADLQIPAIVTLDFANGELDRLPLKGRTAPESPVNVQFAEDGRMFVSDVEKRQVLVYDRDLNLVHQIGPWSEGGRPAGMAIRGDRLYVSDPGDQKIRVFDLQGYGEVLAFDGRETHDSTIVGPTHLYVTEDLDCYVSDSIRNRIFVFDRDGKFSHHVGAIGRVPGTFSRPKGLAIADDLLFVVDAAFENCQILDLEGRPLMFFGGSGEEPGNLCRRASTSARKGSSSSGTPTPMASSPSC